ncbi:hypothetical protein JCM8097_000384 [Rhodosporidiobolus ruineniae]
MCIVFFHVGQPEDPYALIVASNRDEFLARPTTSAAWHGWSSDSASATSAEPTPSNRVLSGLDLTAGGTWFGVSLPPFQSATPSHERLSLRFATLTNFTEVIPPAPRPSRGNLTREFLDLDLRSPGSASTSTSLEEYLSAVEAVKQQYAGFNLLVGEIFLPFPSPAASSSSNPLSPPQVRLAYISNRETSPSKRARILEPASAGKKTVRGLSNATLEVEEGEEEWPKVKSGAEAVEEVVKKLGAAYAEVTEDQLADGLYEALSTPHASPITHRAHLRHTVLVRPLCLDPSLPLPAVPPPLPPPSSAPSNPIAAKPWEQIANGKKENEDGCHWYGTRVQTLLLVRRDGTVVLRERDAYELSEVGRPRWSGKERRFEFRL